MCNLGWPVLPLSLSPSCFLLSPPFPPSHPPSPLLSPSLPPTHPLLSFPSDPPTLPRIGQVSGTVVEVAWASQANHAGGYQYRLCPATEGLSEACFQKTPLEFVGQQKFRWVRQLRHHGLAMHVPPILELQTDPHDMFFSVFMCAACRLVSSSGRRRRPRVFVQRDIRHRGRGPAGFNGA